jgi:hypothetical protein
MTSDFDDAISMWFLRFKTTHLLEDNGLVIRNQAYLNPNISGILTKSIGNVCGDVTDIWFYICLI